MALYENVEHFAGKTVENYELELGIEDPVGKIYRLAIDYDSEEGMADLIATFLEDPRVREISGIVIGLWADAYDRSSQDIVEALVAAREKLPHLTAIFLGDIISEECEISWIVQSDVSPLLAAYPQLTHFRVRGNEGLSLGALRHEKLQSLIIETGGLNPNVVREVCQSQLPELEHLELWLGIPYYGGNTTVADLQPILSGQLFPKLRYLGLRDSEIANDIAVAIATAPILDRIKVLDLSLGLLGDEGASALLASPAVAKLDKLEPI
ncbi:STM4015 family protein [Pseudanabaena sp. PCC 6802]|uniref:STM4015 family protein n=1 Tax=Pseudanabaena sp. PCC 6802 TaxID=118173 RepID=UPI00034D2C0A|nr:STM4015 family protein [Pseudanabaena sp. PCC 6802]